MCSKQLQNLLVSLKSATTYNAKIIDQALTQSITNGIFHATPTWNCILRVYSKSPTPIKAILIYNHYFSRKSSIHPDNYTYPPLLKACLGVFSLPKGQELHAHLTKIGLDSDIYVQNDLIHFYGCMNYLTSARALFDEMPQRVIVSWNTLLSIYNDSCESIVEVLVLFKRLICEEIKADRITLVILLSACAQVGRLDFGRAVHCYATKVGLECMLGLENALLGMYLKCREKSAALRVFDEMDSRRDVVSHTILFKGCAEMGMVELARKIFDMIVVKDIVTWSLMMHVYVKAKLPKDVLKLFEKMVDDGVIPDENTMVSVLSACASLSNLQCGRLLHRFIYQKNIKQDVILKTALIDMYSKCGCLEDALVIFYKMGCKDVFTWTIMIEGLANYGFGNEALRVFNQMERQGIRPNEATYVSVLAACSHSGLVTEGCKLFRRMVIVDQIQPKNEHFGCLIDLFSRAGLLHQAEEFIETMRAEDKLIAYKTLLSACIRYSEFDVGEKAAYKMMKLGLQSHATHILLSNFYAQAGQWAEVAEARRNMKEFDVRKMPGNSTLELKQYL
ncbi:putative pentatricopeptide repeat-containing protein At3g15930 [Mangifera indica]|uniref:putative pentatricopeptide repeat-containing protein At3g15930 n=1 Tax=Mangifera indica TaxID=29780 RepID=UPI001CFA7972|nr:putative pentatricopeptide repeat-containing protein At3g15930 [Mangifera indica]